MRIFNFFNHKRAKINARIEVNEQLHDLNLKIDIVEQKYKETDKVTFEPGVEGLLFIKHTYAPDRAQIGAELSDLQRERLVLMSRVDDMESAHLIAVAESLDLPLPDDDGKNWDGATLTIHGRDALRKAIRKDDKERIEVWQTRLAVLFGSIGAITGITALIVSSKK